MTLYVALRSDELTDGDDIYAIVREVDGLRGWKLRSALLEIARDAAADLDDLATLYKLVPVEGYDHVMADDGGDEDAYDRWKESRWDEW